MTGGWLIDTSVLIDFLRGVDAAATVLERCREVAPLHASEVTRLEVLAGMRDHEELATRSLLSIVTWHPVDAAVAERAGALGRTWLPSHGGIDSADLAIAATCMEIDATLVTKNVRHFPMFGDLQPPY